MSTNANAEQPIALPPPRLERGVVGWAHANLFSSKVDSTLTIVGGSISILALWFAVKWVFFDADWTVIKTLGGQLIIGQYNTVAACPSQNCFWRPQAALILVTVMLGMAWGVAGGGLPKRLALAVGVILAAFALLPYSLDRMGWDVRLLLAANLPAVGLGWLISSYTPIRTVRWIAVIGIGVFVAVILLLRGIEGVPGLDSVSILYWGGLMLNLLLAVGGIVASLPIGIALALGRRSKLPVVKLLCVIFIEVFRGVPLIALLFMSQVLVPLAFPEDFPLNSLLRAAIIITLFSSAYMAENVRGGLQALHPGQAEGARALGLAGWQTTMFISMPQALRNVIPAIVGQFISLFKDTSLVYIIGMLDIVEYGRVFIQGNTEFLPSAKELFVFLALVFWIFCYTMSYVSRRIEQNLGVGQR